MQGLLHPKKTTNITFLPATSPSENMLSSQALNTQGLSLSPLHLYFGDGSLPSTISHYHLQSTFGCQEPLSNGSVGSGA